ncbi:hypothetical protein BaRGS_00013738 [Batillaria attramentaria]|uniref:Uncharacterized protein n=1 Tax=Batillaria attramentaria TaxID=370345 RepID=A0ABD0L6K1_9CAEN
MKCGANSSGVRCVSEFKFRGLVQLLFMLDPAAMILTLSMHRVRSLPHFNLKSVPVYIRMSSEPFCSISDCESGRSDSDFGQSLSSTSGQSLSSASGQSPSASGQYADNMSGRSSLYRATKGPDEHSVASAQKRDFILWRSLLRHNTKERNEWRLNLASSYFLQKI